MAGMKIRLAPNSNLSSNKTKGKIYGILLLILAFAVPCFAYTQEKPNTPKALQASTPTSTPQIASQRTAVKETSEKSTKETAIATAVTDVKVAADEEKTTITVMANKPITPKKFMLRNPRRLILDFPNAYKDIKTERIPIGTDSVIQLRIHQFQPLPSPIVRLVLELEAESGTPDIIFDKNETRIVFAKSQTAAATTSTLSSKPASVRAENTPKAITPSVAPNKPLPIISNKSSALDQKLHTAEQKTAFIATTTAPTQTGGGPVLTDATKAVIVPDNPKPQASPAKDIPAQPPLIAMFSPTAIQATKDESTPNSRYSGHPLTLDLVNVPLVDFFRLMAEEGGINIVLEPSVKGTLTIKVVKMPWDQIFEVALLNNGLDKQVEGSLVRIARKATLQDEAKQQESLKKATLLAADLETRIKRLNYTKATEMKNVIMDQKTVRGTVAVDERTNSLILTDLPFSLQKQIQLIESLDIAQPQVEIEARIVSASRNFARDIGVQFGFLQSSGKGVNIGGTNTGSGLSGTRPSVTPTATNNGAVSVNKTGNYNVNLPATAAFGGVGIAVGNILDTFMLDAAITAGESKGWAKLISQPKVVAQNNNKAVVTQGFRFPVKVNSNNTVTVQFFDAALTLTATPQITYDGNIVLDLKIENNSLDFGRAVENVPSVRTTESSTRVLITDGGTTVIGGIIIENDGNAEDRVPGLGSIPLIKNLFRRSSVTRDSQEILFFVTPKIVK
jgi:type IV pilus secretin PilQ/predicted competence protein